MTDVFKQVVTPALNESFKRKIVAGRGGNDHAIFSYYPPQVIEYHQYQEPHIDTASWLPLYSTRPITDEHSNAISLESIRAMSSDLTIFKPLFKLKAIP